MFDVVSEALASIASGVDALLGADLTMLDRDEVLAVVRELERQRRRLPAAEHRVVAEVDSRNVAGELAVRDTASLLQEVLTITPRDASARVHAARDLGPRREVTGAPLAPLFAATAAAQQAGTISPAHAMVIIRLLEKLPSDVEREHGRAIEEFLVHQAETLDPARLARAAERLRDTLDPDGTLINDRDHQRRRELRLSRNADGSSQLVAHLTPAATAVWEAIFDSLAAPVPAEDGERDPRSAPQRAHDALLDAGLRLLRSGDLPDCSGTPVTVLATVDATQLKERRGHATTSHDGLLSIPELLSLAEEAVVVPVVLSEAGELLGYGRTRRLASPRQREALAARDGGCTFPGCTAPPAWCQSHHVIAWADGGATDLSNLALVCGYHHREFERRGWRCRMVDGVPHWIPPAWLDAEQRPRRNTATHRAIRLGAASPPLEAAQC